MATRRFNWRRNGERSETMRLGGGGSGHSPSPTRTPIPTPTEAGCWRLHCDPHAKKHHLKPMGRTRRQNDSAQHTSGITKPCRHQERHSPSPGMLQILNDPSETAHVPARLRVFSGFGLATRALATAPLIRRTGGREGERGRGRLKGNMVGSAGFPLLP